MAINLYGSFPYFTIINGVATPPSPPSPLDFGSYTVPALVPGNTQPMIIVGISYFGADAYPSTYSGTLTLSFGNVPMKTFEFSRAVISPPYADTRSAIIGLLAFNTGTVFADDHIRLAFTGNPGEFGGYGGAAAVAQNVPPSSAFTGLQQKSTLDVLSPIEMDMPPISAGAGEMLIGMIFPYVALGPGLIWNSPAGTNPFVIETYTPSATLSSGFAYRAISSHETDVLPFVCAGSTSAYATTFKGAVFNLGLGIGRRWFWILN